jgi:2-polyprenyl-6-methoxyphenol hydroxylase-like FAD-dependent oxidoreductase
MIPLVATDLDGKRWIALCGDAAVAFMPTAGVGTSAAMGAAAGPPDEPAATPTTKT